MKYLLLCAALFISFSCTTTKKSDTSHTLPQILKVANDYFEGGNIHFQYNRDSTFLLCSQKLGLQGVKGFYKLKTAVFYVPAGDIVYENQLNYGSVKWVDRYIIEMKSGKGHIDNDGNATVVRRYDVSRNEYTGKSQLK